MKQNKHVTLHKNVKPKILTCTRTMTFYDLFQTRQKFSDETLTDSLHILDFVFH